MSVEISKLSEVLIVAHTGSFKDIFLWKRWIFLRHAKAAKYTSWTQTESIRRDQKRRKK